MGVGGINKFKFENYMATSFKKMPVTILYSGVNKCAIMHENAEFLSDGHKYVI